MPGRSALSLLSKSRERKPGHSLRVLKSFLESEVSAAAAPSSACPLRLFFPPDKTQFLWADQRVRWGGWHCAPSCPHQAQLRPFDHLGHSLTPRMQEVEGRHLQPMGTASPFPAPPPSHGGPGRARVGLGAGGGSGPQEGRCSGERRMSSQLPARPRPCCLCRAQLRAPGPAGARCPPQARRLTHLPRPGTCSPGNAREFSEDSISQGLREPQNSLDSDPGEARERLGGWSTPPFPYLCLSHTLTSHGPQLTAVPSFIMRREKAWGSWRQRQKPPGDTCPLGSCLMAPPWSREKPSFFPLESSVCPWRKYHLPWLSILLCQEVLLPV